MSGQEVELSYRALAMLRAVAAKRATMSNSSEPDLFIDGVPCCDQMTAHVLAHAGLVRPAVLGTGGSRVPAELTEAGVAALKSFVAA